MNSAATTCRTRGDGDAATSDGIFVYRAERRRRRLGRRGARPWRGERVQRPDRDHRRQHRGLRHGRDAARRERSCSCPPTDVLRESLEGMRVTLPQSLVDPRPLHVRPLRRALARPRAANSSRRRSSSPVADERTAPARTLADADLARRRPRRPEPRPAAAPERRRRSAATNSVRSGDRRDERDRRARLAVRRSWRVQPTQGADFTAANPRPAAVPEVGGTTKVASFNVLNYFTTLDAELRRPARRERPGGVRPPGGEDRRGARRDRRRRLRPHRDREQRRRLALDTLVAALNDDVGAGHLRGDPHRQARHRRHHDGVDLQARRGRPRRRLRGARLDASTPTSVRTTGRRWRRPSPTSRSAAR